MDTASSSSFWAASFSLDLECSPPKAYVLIALSSMSHYWEAVKLLRGGILKESLQITVGYVSWRDLWLQSPLLL